MHRFFFSFFFLAREAFILLKALEKAVTRKFLIIQENLQTEKNRCSLSFENVTSTLLCICWPNFSTVMKKDTKEGTLDNE